MGSRTTLAGLLLTATALGGCVSFAGGNPEPVVVSANTSTSPRGEEADTAPAVEVPLDASGFLETPCAVLTPEQLAGFGVDEPGEPTGGAIAAHAGPQCVWSTRPGLDSTIDVGFVTADEHGLADLYAAREREAYFVETEVQGYPAVFHDQDDFRDRGLCNISVGISDSLSFRSAEWGRLDAEGSCARAKQVADAVVTTLRGAA